MIIAESSPTTTGLFVCTGNYSWQSYDITNSKFAIKNYAYGVNMGINYLQAC
jgi:hypothetical protein